MTRRRFFQALAASALAAGVPLPVGFPAEGLKWTASGPGVLGRGFWFTWQYNNGSLPKVEWISFPDGVSVNKEREDDVV